MKSILLTTLTFLLLSGSSSLLYADNTQNDQIKKEIESIVRKSNFKHIPGDSQEVTVHFLINAQNQLVIFDTSGDNDAACAYVKEMLNYRQVKIKQAKQLVPYEISILFVKKGD
jgi:hypothetical protein